MIFLPAVLFLLAMMLVAVLRATGRPMYPINPVAVARYREHTSASGKKSDHVDALAFANILRTRCAPAPDAATTHRWRARSPY